MIKTDNEKLLKVATAFLIFFLVHSLVNADFWIQNIVGVSLFILFMTSLSRRVTLPQKNIEYPPVSIIVPMRNEEKNVVPCLTSLLALDYPNYEIIVGNDSSTDDTRGAVLEVKEKHDSRELISLVDIPSLQNGWTGKTWVLHNAVKKARYDIWLVVDADVRHTPQSLKHSIIYFLANRADIMTRPPWPIIHTPGEWPMIFSMFLLKYSSWFSDSFLKRNQSFPSEQYVLMTKDFYESSGGYSAVKNFIPEVMALINIAHRMGKKVIRMDDDMKDITVRMHEGRKATTQGIVRAMDFRVIPFYPFLAISLIVAWIFSGFANMFIGVFTAEEALFLQGLINYTFFVVLFTWYLSRSRHQRAIGIFAPLLVLNFVYLAILAVFKRTVKKQVIWKERVIDVVQAF